MTDPIRLTASMMEARDTMERFWGERYAEKVAPYREAIRNATRPEEATLSTALRVCKCVKTWAEENGQPMAVILCIAASVEECQPVTGTQEKP